MSRRAELEQQIGRLSEIGEIMSAMKNMALIETRKYARFMTHQQKLVEGIEAAAADLLSFYPELNAKTNGLHKETMLVLIGSERGFCGEFNERVVAALANKVDMGTRLIAVGHRLAAKLEQDDRVELRIDGPNVAEEVEPVLDNLLAGLQARLRDGERWESLEVLAHDENGRIERQPLIPISSRARQVTGHPPKLNGDAQSFYAEMTRHFLAAKLPTLFYASLMAENRKRLEHMESALKRIETRHDELLRHRNAMRQEEITEQIELILLSTEASI